MDESTKEKLKQVNEAFSSLIKMYIDMDLEERKANAKDAYPLVRALYKNIGADYKHINDGIDVMMMHFLSLESRVTEEQYEIYRYATEGYDQRTYPELIQIATCAKPLAFDRMFLDVIKPASLSDRSEMVRFGLSILSANGYLSHAAQSMLFDIYIDFFRD